MAVAFALAGPVLAADPVADGSLTVTFELPVDAGGGPIAGADITLSIHRDGVDLTEGMSGVTDASGSVAFEGLPRATDGAPILIDVEASWHEPLPPGDCAEVPAWTAAADGVVSDVGVAVSLVATPTTFYGCGGSGPATDLDHVVMDGRLEVAILPEGVGSSVYVTLDAMLDDGEAIWSAFAWTDGDGRATFADLPRPDAEGPAITWSIVAAQSEQLVVDGCSFSRFGDAATDVKAIAGTTALDLELAYRLEGEGCEAPPEGAPVITGLAVDEAGGPVTELYFLQVTQVRADGGRYQAAATAAGDGTFEARVHPWGTVAEPSHIEVSATGPVTRTVDDGECVTTYALMGRTSVDVALADFEPTDVIVLALAEDVLQAICGETETPGPDDGGSSGGGSIPLPATDTVPEGGSPTTWLILAALLGGLARALRRSRVASVAR